MNPASDIKPAASRVLSFATATLLAASMASAAGAQAVWDGSADDLWTNPANWTPAGVPGTGDDPTFNGSGAGVIDLDGSTLTYNEVFFDVGPYTLTNGILQTRRISAPASPTGGSVTFQNTLAGQPPFPGFGFTSIIEFSGGPSAVNTYTVDGPNGGNIADATGGVDPTQLVIGPGATVRLNGANTYTGGTQINGGVVIFDNDAAFGTGTISTPGNAGVIAPAGERTIANDFEIASNSGIDLRIGNQGGGNLTHTGDILLNLNARNIAVNENTVYTWTGNFVEVGVFSDSLFTFGGAGKIVIEGARTTSVDRIVLNTAEVEFNDDSFLGTTAAITFGGPGTTVRPIGARTLTNDVTWAPTDDGVMTLDGDLTISGAFNTVNDISTPGGGNPKINVINGGSLTLNGTIDTQVNTQRFLIGGDGTGVVTITSDQTLDGDQIQLDAGGELRVTSNGVFDGGSVLGLDRDAKLTPVGNIALGADAGVVFTNRPTIANGGLGVSGAEGSLTVNADVEAGFEPGIGNPGGDGLIKLHDGGSVTFNGAVSVADDLTLESDGTAGTVVFNGTTEIDNRFITDTNVTTLVNGTLGDLASSTDGDPVQVWVNGTLGGTGTINSNVSAFGGTIAPGASAGTLTVDGDVTLDAVSTLAIELGGAGAGQFDLLTITDNLAVAGTFEVSLLGGFNPIAGASFDVLDFGSVSGAFDSLVLPTLDPGLAFNTDDLLTTGVLSIESVIQFLIGDANKDGIVSADDFASIQSNFGNSGSADGTLLGDANGDGLVSADDFASVQANFGNSLPAPTIATAGLLATATVPEPASAIAVGTGIAALTVRRRDRRK